MINIDDKKMCCGCEGCKNICPKNAIEMKADNEGFLYPVIDKSKCIQCGLCQKVCPILCKSNRINNTLKVYAAWSKDTHTRNDSTSGGIFSEIARNVYSKGGYVCGAIYDDNMMVKHYLSNDIEDLAKIRSSKYLQSNIDNVFRQIKEKLIENKIVLFCGSPCQVDGLKNFLGKEYDNLITIDFICRGMNSPKIFKMYLEYLKQKYKSDIVSIKFKDKTKGWHNFSTKITFKNGKSYLGGRYLDSFMVGYLKYNAFIRPSCYDCKFKGKTRASDFTLADFWGIEKIDKKLDEDKGTSMILVNTPKGEKVFKELSKFINYKEINSDKAFSENKCFEESVKKTKNRELVFENIDKMEYKQLSDCFFPVPKGKEKIKILIRNSRFYKKLRNK